MATAVLIMGESGSGKSRSIKGLPPEQTFIINGSNKDLPFKGWEKKYTKASKKNPNGNMYVTDLYSKAQDILTHVNNKMPHIKYVVIDDNQYFSLNTFITRVGERAYFDKFVDIAVHLVEIMKFLKSMRKDIIVFVLNHIETGTTAQGVEQIQAKTMGKFVKEKVTFEGLFTTVLLCDKEASSEDGSVNHFFWTRLANSTVKTPEEMFEEQKIPNDLMEVVNGIKNYSA